MKEKKTAVITFRTEEWVKERLELAAEQNKWSVAQTVNELCKKFVVNPHPEQIIVKAKDLIQAAEDIKKENPNGAVNLKIDLEVTEDEQDITKVINYEVWECGGLGCVVNFDPIYEMTPEEIKEIP